MQDTPNLKRKAQRYQRMVADFLRDGDINSAEFWQEQMWNIEKRIKARDKNRKKNIKQHKKAN